MPIHDDPYLRTSTKLLSQFYKLYGLKAPRGLRIATFEFLLRHAHPSKRATTEPIDPTEEAHEILCKKRRLPNV